MPDKIITLDNLNTFKALLESAVSPDADKSIQIENNYSSDDYANRTNYGTAITLNEFVANCESGTYTNPGIIAKINNYPVTNKSMRIILIGVNHDTLAVDGTTKAKTTWQFLDCPMGSISLGLPTDLRDWTGGGSSEHEKLANYVNGTNDSSMTLKPTNVYGLISASGLMESAHNVYDNLPFTIKSHIKMVWRSYYVKRQRVSYSSSQSQTRQDSTYFMFCNVFHLAGTDIGLSGPSGEGSRSRYAYFASSATSARRIRFYNSSAVNWFYASPIYNYDYPEYWSVVNFLGGESSVGTDDTNNIAPAFCI